MEGYATCLNALWLPATTQLILEQQNYNLHIDGSPFADLYCSILTYRFAEFLFNAYTHRYIMISLSLTHIFICNV